MKSTMLEVPLSVARILTYGATTHRHTTITTYFGEEGEVTTFQEVGARAAALAHALADSFGIATGDRVATMQANCTEHVETMLGVMAMGAVFHPLNRYLADDQITYCINHAQDRVIIVDPVYARLLMPLLHNCPSVEALIVIGADVRDIADIARDEHLPERISVHGYEEILDGRPTEYDWPVPVETDAAAMCYSTGTEGVPKAVVYSHRSLWLHSLNLRAADSFGVRNGKAFLCCVPIYHVLSWGVPLAAFMAGAPLVFTGRSASPKHLAHVIADAMPRQAHGSPAVWTSLLVHFIDHPPTKMSLQEIYSGGSQVSPALIDLFEERYGVDMVHAWGMTETGPVGTVAHPPAGVSGEARARYRHSQGRFHVGMEYRIVDDAGNVLEINDRSTGELQVRGNTITGAYHHSATTEGGVASLYRGQPVDDQDDRFTADGWLRTGDIGTISQDGYLLIHDRKADVIRSGGEWIYSAALENYLHEAPTVVEVAVIGIPDERWGQRPLAVVVLADGVERSRQTAEDLARGLREKVPGWMVPEYWTFVGAIDKTSVDKFDKKDLRTHYREGHFSVIDLRTDTPSRSLDDVAGEADRED